MLPYYLVIIYVHYGVASIISQFQQDYFISMKQLKPKKKEPFFVKRIRLRQSILKTNQILQTLCSHDCESNKNWSIGGDVSHQFADSNTKSRRLTIPNSNVEEGDLYNCKTCRFNVSKINSVMKAKQVSKNSERTCQLNNVGLQVRRIIGDPQHKRSYQYNRALMQANDRKAKNGFNLTVSKRKFTDAFMEASDPSQQQTISYNNLSSNIDKANTIISPSKKCRSYLYQKLAQSTKIIHIQQNQVYQKRIKSYTQFLWKCLISHNVYVNLDLKLPNPSLKKLKAFVGYGNNCNMIKGLLKRRYWWTISQQMGEDCLFIWSQTKINKVYQRQQRASINQSNYLAQQYNILQDNEDDYQATLSSSFSKRETITTSHIKKYIKQTINRTYIHHHKITNKHDFVHLKKIYKQNQLQLKILQKEKKKKELTSYEIKTQQVKMIKAINVIGDIYKIDIQNYIKGQQNHHYYKAKPLVHNHLPNNFYLGNKKALFYNLRQYYSKIGQDVFNYVPLTFHIKQGFKDSQYLKFTKVYEQRAKIIKRQQNSLGKSKKTRNIWIVKPGQNSNQGRGITVIDEVYQLNRIIKEANQTKNSNKKSQQLISDSEDKTFIVQMYIDRPFLYNDRKFDIRHYMLITNLYGVTKAYWYQQGYIRTSAYFFNIHNFEPQIHLTNDAIQKKYPDYGKYQPYNKISYAEFQNYLNTLIDRKYNFKEQILTKMKVMAKDAAKSVYTKISPHNQMHNFQIFGLDFMIDRNFKPWLIEINTNPCLDCVCPLLDRIIPYMVEQGLKLSLDLVYPPPSHYPNTSKHYAPLIELQTFKYQLIFDSLSEGQQLRKLYCKDSNILNEIGIIQEDEQFKDNGKEIKLQDFT